MSGFASIARNSGGAGGANTSNAAATTTFGEGLVAQLTPNSQATFVHGLNPTLFITSSIGAGASVTGVSGSAVLQSGTATTGSAVVQMRRGLTYRAGQGSLFRGTAIFGTPVADTYQLMGFGNIESGFYFGYRGTDFGIHHITGGVREVRKLTITAGVASTTNVTVTLNGDSRTFPIAGGGSINQTSWEIAYQDYTTFGGGWKTEAFDGSIYFISMRVGPTSGSFSATGTGLVASFSQTIAGVLGTDTFVSQSAWNIDKMDGTGPSRFNLNKQLGNVYQVGFQYLGFGNTRFAVEDSATGLFQACHMINQANARTTPVVRDPHMQGLWAVANAGSVTSTYMSGTSGAIFCEGEVSKNIGPAFSISAANPDIDTAEEPVLTIRTNRLFRGTTAYGEIDVATLSATSVTTGAHFVTLRVYKNLRLTGPVNFQYVNEDQSCASYDTAATSFTANQNTLVATYILGSGASLNLDLKGDNFFLSVGESLTITAQASTNNIDCAVALTWFEDQ